MTRQRRSVAIVGPGIAEAALAQALAKDGHDAHVFDKVCRSGGRMATRRLEWLHGQRPCAERSWRGRLAYRLIRRLRQPINTRAHTAWRAQVLSA